LTDPRRANSYINSQSNRHLDTIATMNEIADMTGGKAYYNNNDIGGMLVQAQQDGQNYYMLSYALDKTDTKPGWRKLKVKSARDGISVRSRSGFYVTKTTNDPQFTRRQDVTDALESPIDYTGFPVRVVLGDIKDAGNGKRDVSYRMLIPPGNLTIDEENTSILSMDVAYSVTDHQGNIVDRNGGSNNLNLNPAQLKSIAIKGMVANNVMHVPPGDYTVRFVIRDNLSGKIGSTSVPLTVP